MKDKLNKYVIEGTNYFKQNNFSQASLIFKKALKKFPDQYALYTYLIPCLINQYKYEEALIYAKKFHQTNTMLEFSSIYLGIIYFQTTQLNLSLQYFDKVLNINSENYNALVNKAAALNKLDRNLEAKQLLDKALTIDPSGSVAYRNYAAIYEDDFELKKAEEFYIKAIQINKKDHQSIFALSQMQLSNKNYEEGWRNFEHRWLKGTMNYRFSQIRRLTNLNDIEGKKILVWHEQGLGDTIQFSRYVRHLIQLGANIVFEVQKPLIKFLRLQFDCEVTGEISDTNFDYQSPLLSLPLLFRNEKENFKFAGPFFYCSLEKVNAWKERLNLSKHKLNLGITISGNTKQINEDRRKIPLDYFIDFLEFSKIFIIQKDISNLELDLIKQHDDLIFLGNDKNWENMTDTSAILQNMDFLVSIDTSIIHLAGSMNKDCLLLLSKPAEWRWAQSNENMPKWYESVRVIRQSKRRDWDTILNAVNIVLKEQFKNKNMKKVN